MANFNDEVVDFKKGIRVQGAIDKTRVTTETYGANTSIVFGAESRTPAQLASAPISASGNILVAAIEAGATVLVPGITGKVIRVVDWTLVDRGADAAGATAVVLQDTNTSPVPIASIAVAPLDVAVHVKPTTANVTNGTDGINGGPLTSGKGITMVKTGAALTGTTSIDWNIIYTVASA